MIQGRCPICSKPFQVASLDDHPSFPFCSDRCKLIDLGRWIDGAYAIPGASVKADRPGDAAPAERPDEDPETD
jgi:endogenous inhibitor of DNA gyrase (YacG/DUF329 family)